MKESFKEWILQRQKEVEYVVQVHSLLQLKYACRWLPEGLNAMTLNPPAAMPIIQPTPSPSQALLTPAPEPELISKSKSKHKQQEEFVHQLPLPDSDIWEHMPQSQLKSSCKPLSAMPSQMQPNQTALKPLQEEFTLDLPPPDSSMWESMTPFLGTSVPHKKLARRAG